MKRVTQLALGCVIVLMMASFAAAQQVPQQVIRIGDWVEIGNEAFMNIIGTADLRYRWTSNYDFEADSRDRAANRDPFSTVPPSQEADLFWVLAQFGVDFRYDKNLKARVLFRHETTLDGNLVDNRENDANPGGTDAFGRAAVNEGEGTNLERIWIDYTFPGSMDWLRMFVGSEVWCPDQACLLSDDDPRFTVYANFGPKKEIELFAAAVIQTESLRLGLQNDNDFIYYTFGASYDLKPHRFALNVTYFRERAQGAPMGADVPGTVRSGGLGFLGQKHDSVMIAPSWTGTIGPVRGLLQFSAILGTAEGASQPGLLGVPASREYDIFGWSALAYIEANLGPVTPFLGGVYGSADDDSSDTDLNAFMTLPQREITILSSGPLAFLERTIAFGARDVACPARKSQAFRGGDVFGGQECGHTVGNPYNDRIGNFSHAGINSTYSNPGVLLIMGGLKAEPVKGHELWAAYLYRAMVDTALVEQALGVNVDETQYHEIHAGWQWTLNRHFDIRLAGSVVLPGEGSKDIAQTVFTCGDTGTARCEGEDVALAGEARFRVVF